MNRARLRERAKHHNPDSALSSVLGWAETIFMAVFAMILIFTFLLRIIIVEGSSMESTLFHDDKLIISNLFYKPQLGDIVVIDSDALNEVIIKRVIGTENDVVQIDYGSATLSVNGEIIDEPYVKGVMTDTGSFDEGCYDEDTGVYTYYVPENCVFVLGDNRNHSTDSRTIGFVPMDEILGRVMFRYYSEGADVGRVE